MTSRNRRRDVRVPVSFAADRHRHGLLEAGTVLDASARGLQVHVTDAPPQTGELVRLTVHLPTGALTMNVVAMRVQEAATGHVVACRIFILGPPDRELWERAVLTEVRQHAQAA